MAYRNIPPIDIIVPIYNAYDQVKVCVASLLIHSPGNSNIILINDKSTDPRIREYLNKVGKLDDARVNILFNDKNLGFVSTVNKGMAFSDNDVIILNSDTVVTRGWVQKMVECAAANPLCATVTPLTNNGTICSVPDFCANNFIPRPFSMSGFANFIEEVSLRQYPELPTGVGFCMLIRRKAIKEIGLFDAKAFPRGYGEENDFCCKATERGYVNILDDATYIYHYGSCSFLGEKEALYEKNSEILAKRHPWYFPAVHEFIQKNPLMDIHDNIRFRMKTWNEKAAFRPLFILHNRIDNASLQPHGGTELHIKMLVHECVKRGATPYTLVAVKDYLLLTEFGKDNILHYKFKLDDKLGKYCFEHKNYKQILQKIITTFKIDFAHIHHLLFHPLSTIRYLHETNIPVALTVHDFFLVCPSINLLNHKWELCDGSKDEKECSACAKQLFGEDVFFVKKWRKEVEEQLKFIEFLFFPSSSCKSQFLKYFPEINRKKIYVIPHALPRIFAAEKPVCLPPQSGSKKFSILFLGGMAPIKGSRILADFLRRDLLRDSEEVFILGRLGDPVLEQYLNKRRVTSLGEYSPDDVFDHIEKIKPDIICLISICHETFAFTLSEAWHLGIPVLVSPLGALAERMMSTEAGWILEELSADGLRKAIDKIRDDKKQYHIAAAKAKQVKLKTPEEMFNAYFDLYNLMHGNSTRHKIFETSFSNKELLSAIKREENYYETPINNLQTKWLCNAATLTYRILGPKLADRIRRNPILIRTIKSIFNGLAKSHR